MTVHEVTEACASGEGGGERGVGVGFNPQTTDASGVFVIFSSASGEFLYIYIVFDVVRIPQQ